MKIAALAASCALWRGVLARFVRRPGASFGGIMTIAYVQAAVCAIGMTASVVYLILCYMAY